MNNAIKTALIILGLTMPTTAVYAAKGKIVAFYDYDKTHLKFKNATNHKAYVRICRGNNTVERFNVPKEGTQEIQAPASPDTLAVYVFRTDNARDNSKCVAKDNGHPNPEATAPDGKGGVTYDAYEAVKFNRNEVYFDNDTKKFKEKYMRNQHYLRISKDPDESNCFEFTRPCDSNKTSVVGANNAWTKHFKIKSANEMCNEKIKAGAQVTIKGWKARCENARDHFNPRSHKRTPSNTPDDNVTLDIMVNRIKYYMKH